MKTDLVDIKEDIHNARYILILTHKNPDADTISCALALSNYCFEHKIKHKVFNISSVLPRELDFLPRFDKITDQLPKFFDLVVYVDCADIQRVALDLPSEIKTINIDHHQSNTLFADINIVDDTKASTAELMYEVLNYSNMTISKNMATAIYTGIYDDSIAFTTPRVDSRTFFIVNDLIEKTKISPSDIATKFLQRDSLAKYRILPKVLDTLELHKEGVVASVYLESIWLKQTGAIAQECDEVVDMILKIAIVQVVVYLREIDGKVRVSLRSKGDIDVSNIAQQFDGGGHKNAAGCTIDTDDIQEAKDMVIKSISF